MWWSERCEQSLHIGVDILILAGLSCQRRVVVPEVS